MSKPRVITRCVANSYAAKNERIVEFSFPDGKGGLISLITDANGQDHVQLYRVDEGIKISVPRQAKAGKGIRKCE